MKPLVLGDLARELATTRTVLERVEDEHLEWKPHEKSMSLGGLAMHCANLLHWQVSIANFDEYDIATAGRVDPPKSHEDVLFAFDRLRHELVEALENMDDDALLREWTLKHGDRVIFTMPRAAALRTFGLSHIIHHRGQLTVYLRLLDIPVPAIYGPSADEGSL